MTRRITQRELRNDTPAIMRAVEAGESFVLTRNGTPIADLVPHVRTPEPRRATGADLIAARAELAVVEPARFFDDLDRYVDADPLRSAGEPERSA
jgi:prevent-host-death family protein